MRKERIVETQTGPTRVELQKPELPSMEEHWIVISTAGRHALSDVIARVQSAAPAQLNQRRPGDTLNIVLHEYEGAYREALDQSLKLSEMALLGQREYPGRSRWNNEQMDALQQRVSDTISPHHLASVLDGLVISSHRGGLKELIGSTETVGDEQQGEQLTIHDTLLSATSINFGAGFPYTAAMSVYETQYGIIDNMCMPYHVGAHQIVAAEMLKETYPRTNPSAEGVKFIAESSGTAVNSMAVEAVVAYAEKAHGQLDRWMGHSIHGIGAMTSEERTEAIRQARSQMVTEIVSEHPELRNVVNTDTPTLEDLHVLEAKGHIKLPKVLAIDGTWCGGFGTAKEGTGFGVAQQSELRGARWLDRSLPLPTAENREEFLRILREKIASGEAAGVIIEPNIVGDAGIINVDTTLLTEMTEILREGINGQSLPLIADCVQQGSGRTGEYYGFEADEYAALRDYPLLITTTAKSASNGQPFGFSLMPQPIIEAAYPLSMITTNAGNGAILRAALIANFVRRPEIQAIIDTNAAIMEQVATAYGLTMRGQRMNRGINAGSADAAEYLQWALLLQDGILTGGLPSAVRFQPMLLEHPETIWNLMHTVCRRIKQVEEGNIPPYVIDSFNASGLPSGLNRE